MRDLSGGYVPGRDALRDVSFAAGGGRDRRRARSQRRRQDDALPRPAGRAPDPARRGRAARPAGVRAPDRARAARLPRQRVRRRADGRLRAHALVPARRRAATATPRAPRWSASGSRTQADASFGALSGGQRQRVLIARALLQDAPVLLLDEPLSGVDSVSAARIEALFAELRAEGRTLLVATHDVRQAGEWDRVLCLNGRQVDYGRPAAVLSPETLRETYGARADRARGRRPRGRRRPSRARALMLGWLTDPFASPILQRALVELLILSLACGPLGVWVLLYRDAYAAESISHGMLPGLVVAALAGAPLLLGAVAGRARRRGRDRARGARPAARRRRRRRRLRLDAVRAGRDARALAGVAAAARRSCCSATCSASAAATSRSPARWPAASRSRCSPATGRWRSSASTAARRRRSARGRCAGSSRCSSSSR